MKGLIRSLLLVFIASTSLPASADKSDQGNREDSQRFYQTLLDSTNLVFPGAALLVDGAGEYFNGTTGYANLRTGQPWQPDTPFFAGSIGKTFIAVAVMQLWDENLLTLDDTLTRWLEPAITDHLPGADTITLRHLLNHTSGFIDLFAIPEWVEAIIVDPDLLQSDEESLMFAYDLPLQFEPGSQHQYSNTGYLLLAMVIQRVTGEHASVAVRQGILDPLGLTHTYYQVYEGDGSALIHGYHFEDGELVDTHPWIRNFALGAAPMASTTADLGRFYRAIFKDPRLLSRRARKEMLENNLVGGMEPFDQYGLGIVKSDWSNITSYWHNGGIEGYKAIVRYFPDQDLVLAGFVNITVDSVDGVIYPQPANLFETKVLSIVMARLSARDRTHRLD
jgi:D-alanyl-D-alanine carboxypeptidase